MPVKYAVVLVKNPKTKLYEARARAVNSLVTERQVYKQLAKESTLTSTDIAGTIRGFLEYVTSQLLLGNAVKLGEFGTFYTTLRSDASLKPDTFNAAMVRSMNVRFRPGRELKEGIHDFELMQVITKKAAAAAKAKVDETRNSRLSYQAAQAAEEGE